MSPVRAPRAVLLACTMSVAAAFSRFGARPAARRFRQLNTARAAAPTAGGVRSDLRNIAIVAHVDHGKTTLVDAMLQTTDAFKVTDSGPDVRLMDSDDQERERGITILAKNCAITYKGTKINIVDTPGHADFGGEVERVLNMVDSVLLVVDSVEGPKPQTRFVLSKAIEKGLKIAVVVNKIDRPAARPEYVIDKTFDLFVELGATDEQVDFPIVYASALNGISGDEPDAMTDNMDPLFEKVLGLPAPIVAESEEPLQLMVANIAADEFKGRLAIGRITAGGLKKGQTIGATQPGQAVRTSRISELFIFTDLGRTAVEEATAGDIVMVAGFPDVSIGDTLCDPNDPKPLEPIAVEEPTVRMTIGVNKSPLAGQSGKKLTSRVIFDRLNKELETNVALKVEESDSADVFIVSGRGQMHLTVLIENMRREGFELFVGPPRVVLKEIGGKKHEPFECVEVRAPQEVMGAVIDILAQRKGDMIDMVSEADGFTSVKYVIPTRGMIGVRNRVLTATRGEAIIESQFDDYKPHCGDLPKRDRGSLVAYESGDATSFGVLGAQGRGNLFIKAQDPVYEDMIIGINQRDGDLKLNVCKKKALNNIRSATKETTEGIVPPIDMSLDAAVEYIADDELVEVTPDAHRLLKNPDMGKKANRR